MSDYGGCLSEAVRVDFDKDPDETIDYAFNWADRLDGDTITASSFLLPDGLTQTNAAASAFATQIFVSGGSAGATYRITNRITTLVGRTMDWTVRVYVRDK